MMNGDMNWKDRLKRKLKEMGFEFGRDTTHQGKFTKYDSLPESDWCKNERFGVKIFLPRMPYGKVIAWDYSNGEMAEIVFNGLYSELLTWLQAIDRSLPKEEDEFIFVTEDVPIEQHPDYDLSWKTDPAKAGITHFKRPKKVKI